MVKPNQVERRRHPRVQFEAPVDFIPQDGGLACQLKDISRSGAAVILNRPLKELEMLGLNARIAYPDMPEVELDGTAVVIRCEPDSEGRYEVGLFFHELAETSRAQLDAFLEAMTFINAEN